MTQEPKEVYKGIAAVTRALGRAGISKDRKNAQQGYNFRGIDDIYNALSSELAHAELCIIPRIVDREVVERQTRNGGVLFYVTIKAEYDIVSAADGSCHTASAYGEAMDSGDKATNKAMSAAYKYMAMQLFCIPTEGDNDADATTHEVAPHGASYTRPQSNGNRSAPSVDPPSPPADDLAQLADAVKKLRETERQVVAEPPAFVWSKKQGKATLERERAASRDRLYDWLTSKAVGFPPLDELDDASLIDVVLTTAGL